MTENCFVSCSASSLSTLGLIPSSSTDLCVLRRCSSSPAISPWNMVSSCCSLSLSFSSGSGMQRPAGLTVKDWGKESIKCLSLFLILCHSFPLHEVKDGNSPSFCCWCIYRGSKELHKAIESPKLGRHEHEDWKDYNSSHHCLSGHRGYSTTSLLWTSHHAKPFMPDKCF